MSIHPLSDQSTDRGSDAAPLSRRRLYADVVAPFIGGARSARDTIEDYRRRHAALLSIVSGLLLVVICLTMTAVGFARTEEGVLLRYTLPQAIVALFCFGCYRLAMRGHTNLAGGLYCAVLIVVPLVAMAATGESQGATMFLALTVLVAALVLTPRAILWVVLANIGALGVLLMVAPPEDIGHPMVALMLHAMFLIVVGLLCYASARVNLMTFARLTAAKHDAEQSSRAKSAFLANMSHELRTPLNAIIGYSELIEEELVDEEITEYAEDFDKITHAANHLLVLIGDLLDLSKIEAGKLSVHPRRVALDPIIDELVQAGRALATKNGNTLEAEVDAVREMSAVTDPIRVRQIGLNFLSNAAKFTSDGTITLRVLTDQDALVLEVEDTGIGMTAEQLERVFDEFEQAESTTAACYGGSGLGLTIVQRLCDLLGGDITARSTPEQGSLFRVTFPDAEVAHSSPPSP